MALSDAPNFVAPSINPAWKMAIVRSSWHNELTSVLATDCQDRLVSLGIPQENILEILAPGSFEVPFFCNMALTELGFDGCVAFGVILQGATHHAELIGSESARACMDIQIRTGKPVIYEILHVKTIEDAKSRSIGKNGKGPLAAETLISCLAKKQELQR